MALKSTVFSVALQISDMDRSYYQTHALKLARHPSETEEHMMVRLVAFALHAVDSLEFGRGLSTADEPDLWSRTADSVIRLWIDLGQPDRKRIRKACASADQVVIIGYNKRAFPVWWQQERATLSRYSNLRVVFLEQDSSEALTALTRRSMELTCTLQDDQCWLGDAETTVPLQIRTIQPFT